MATPVLLFWDPDLIPGGWMFRSAADFRDYVQRAEVIGSGVLQEWEGRRGTARVESLLAGTLPEEHSRSAPLVYSGGFMRAKIGDRVLFLLEREKGDLRLHSFCAASGLYPYSERLAALVGQYLPRR